MLISKLILKLISMILMSMILMSMILMSIPLPFQFHCSDPIKAAELAFERAAEAAARAAEQGEIEEEEDTGPKPILPYSSFFILSSTNP